MTSVKLPGIDKIRTIKTIFNWYCDEPVKDDESSPESHCLLRIYINESKEVAIIVLSELYSNRNSLDIEEGFISLAKNICQQIPEIIPYFSEEKTIWLTHYGKFSEVSSYTTFYVEEEYCQKKLKSAPSHQLVVGETIVLTPRQVREIFQEHNLKFPEPESIDDILQELGHDNQQ